MTTYSQVIIDMTVQLGQWVEQRRRTEESITQLVHDMRDAGASWRQIAVGLETTTQSAWERYGMTLEQKLQRSRQNTRSSTQPTLYGLIEEASTTPDKGRVTRKGKRAKKADQG